MSVSDAAVLAAMDTLARHALFLKPEEMRLALEAAEPFLVERERETRENANACTLRVEAERDALRAQLEAEKLRATPTHVCLDCGALGHAGGYHDHGGGEAGDTCTIRELIDAALDAGAVEDERDELRAECGSYRAERDAARADVDALLEAIAAVERGNVSHVAWTKANAALYDTANEIAAKRGDAS